MDLAFLAQEAADRELAARQALEAARPRPARVVRQRSVADRIELQGIVATPGGGIMALINGERLQEGDAVEGLGVVIKKITMRAVVFKHGTRTFTKQVE